MVTGRYQKSILDNGIRVVSETLDNTQSVAIGFWIAAGSRFERSRTNGISHLMEHMVFKGTKKRNAYEIAVSLESLGGHLNAFTEKELTCYYALILDRHLPTAVEVISDIIQSARLDLSDLKIEKEVILEEFRNLLDSPEDYIHDLFAHALYKNHPLALPILGSPDSIRSIGIHDLHRFHERFFAPDRLIVAAAGQVGHSELVSLVEKNLTGLHLNQKSAMADSNEWDIRLPETKSIQAHICTGFKTFPYSDSRKFPMWIIDTYLGQGMSSLLFQELREKRGLAYSIYSFSEYYQDTGMFGIYAGTELKQKKRIEELIHQLIQGVVKAGLTQEELQRIQSQLTGSLLLSMEDASRRMHRLAKMEHYLKKYVSVEQVIDAICGLTLHDIQQTLELFQTESFTHVSIGS
jgi:predicted Zn-dependent peptidase